jgi:hypothetical protein
MIGGFGMDYTSQAVSSDASGGIAQTMGKVSFPSAYLRRRNWTLTVRFGLGTFNSAGLSSHQS